MRELRVIYARIEGPANDGPTLYGAEIVLDDNNVPLGMRYYSNREICGFCGAVDQCIHGPSIENGVMLAWDLRWISRRILSVTPIEPSDKKWWRFTEDAKVIVERWNTY